MWLKKEIGKKEWENYYSKISSYCLITYGNIYEVGFFNTFLPEGCQECSELEQVQIDKYRKNANIRPFPIEEEQQETFEDEQERRDNLEELKKLKKELKNVFNNKGQN